MPVPKEPIYQLKSEPHHKKDEIKFSRLANFKYWGNVGPVSPRGGGTQSASNSHFQHLISWLMCLFFLFLSSLSCDGSLFQILMKLSKFASSLYSAVNWALRITFFSLSLQFHRNEGQFDNHFLVWFFVSGPSQMKQTRNPTKLIKYAW